MKLLRKLQSINYSDTSKLTNRLTYDFNPVNELLYKSQQVWVSDSSPLMIADKGRQVGFSWCDSLKSVIDAVVNERNTYYTSFNKDTTENYIRYATLWAKQLNAVLKTGYKTELINHKDTLVYRVRFSNGKSITALAGNATNLRDKPASSIVIDEAAFRQDLPAIMDAALAALVWGGTVRVFSTHYGIDSDFNVLLQSAPNRDFSVHSIPFRKAVNEGLFKRVCLRKCEVWTQDKETAWVDSIYRKYGSGARQELDCIPSDNSGLNLFTHIEFTENYIDLRQCVKLRSWDLAATERGGCYSVGTLMALDPITQKIFILDSIWGQWGATTTDDIIKATAISDGRDVTILVESEPGSASIRWGDYMTKQLYGYSVQFMKPVGDKLTRAIPLANAVNTGSVVFVHSEKIKELVQNMKQFSEKPKPLVTDTVDSVSQGYGYLQQFFLSGMLGT